VSITSNVYLVPVRVELPSHQRASRRLARVPVVGTSGIQARGLTAIATGGGHTFAVANSCAYCLGNNSSGETGNNSTSTSLGLSRYSFRNVTQLESHHDDVHSASLRGAASRGCKTNRQAVSSAS
jgi:hypothetical protein